MDAVLEFAIKAILALTIVWALWRVSFVFFWMVQPFMAGFLAGFLVAMLFVIRLKR